MAEGKSDTVRKNFDAKWPRFHPLLPWILLLLFLPWTLGAQESTQERELIRDTINTVAAVMQETGPQRIEWALEQSGFKPPDTETQEWKRWPASRKLQYAYLSAEAAEPGQGKGKDLLRQISRFTANEAADAIRDETSLKSFFPEERSEPLRPEPTRRFQFAELSTAEASRPVPPEIGEMVRTIARYSGAFPGGTTALLGRCCGLKPSQGYEVLYRVRSLADALNRGLVEGKVPPGLRNRFLRLLIEVVRYNDAVIPVVQAKLGAEFARNIVDLAQSGGSKNDKIIVERLRSTLKERSDLAGSCASAVRPL